MHLVFSSDLNSRSRTNAELFDGETNITSLSGFAASVVLFRLIIRMIISVEKVASALDIGWEVLG